MKNTLSEMKCKLEGINRVGEEDDWATNIDDEEAKVTKLQWQEKKSRDYNNKLGSLWDKVNYNSIHVIGVPEGGEWEQEVEKLFEEIIMENLSHLVKEIDIQPQEAQRVPRKRNPKRFTQDTS